MRLGSDDHLLDRLGTGFTLLYAVDAGDLPAALRDCIATVRARGVPLKVLAVGVNGPVQGADEAFPDANGHLRTVYGMPGAGAAYLLRPDQHVCARWLTLDATRLQAAFARALPQ